MSEVSVADRSRLLRSKKAELSGIVKSRKRKLREFFAVCDNCSPIPQLDVSNPDTPPINPAEAHFLDVTDILQDRLFDESNLPTRRQIRLDSLQQNTIIEKNGSNSFLSRDRSSENTKLQNDDITLGKNRITLSGIGNSVDRNTILVKDRKENHKSEDLLSRRFLSKSSQAHFPVPVKDENRPTSSRAFALDTTLIPFRNSNLVESSAENTACIRIADTREATVTSTDITNAPKTLLPQVSRTFDLLEDGKSSLPSSTSQDTPTQEGTIIKRNEDGNYETLSNAASSVDQCMENISSPNSNIDNCSAVTSTIRDASTDTSADLECRHDEIKTFAINDDNSNAPSQEKPRKKMSQFLKNEKTNNNRASFLHDEVTLGKSSNFSDTVSQEESLVSSDRQDQDLERSQKKKTSNRARNLLEQNDNLAIGLGLRTISDLKSSTQSVSIKAKSRKNKKHVNDEVNYQTFGTHNTEVNIISSEVPYGRNDSIKLPVINPIRSTEKSSIVEDSSEHAFLSKSKVIPPITTPGTVMVPPSLERRNTRIGSGVLERKNVSEILGDLSASSGPNSKSPTKSDLENAKILHITPRSTHLPSSATRLKILTQKQKEKERSKLSNVIFANKSLKTTSENSYQTVSRSQSLKEDYFIPLFIANASAGKGCYPALENLLTTSHKTITTSNTYVPIYENQTAKILKRIYNLQSSNKWSLRQPKRSVEPIRNRSHWDILLQEASWMRTDFKEERKWKKTIAGNMAFACAEWVSSSQDDRKTLQVKAAPLNFASTFEDTHIVRDSHENSICATPNLSPLRENNVYSDDFEQFQPSLLEAVIPTEIFGLQNEDVIFGLQKSHIADKLLSELPIYGSPLQTLVPKQQTSELDPDRFIKRPALPLSKYIEGKIRLKVNSPPRKKSRFEYEEEDDDDEIRVEFGRDITKKSPLPPESTEVALFDPKNRHILERIRNVNCFRPPSEFQMPLQSFFECRTASQWTWEEDKELKALVRDYTYNWSLISSILTSKSKSNLSTGAERRTPWECFERWIELEGLPGDMQKTYYFRLYTSRIENANRNIITAQSSQSVQGQIQQPRKKSTASVRVERRRNQKHLVLIDTMRKLAKKRETTIQKQQHAASMAAMRKAQEIPHVANRNLSTTPQDFSRIRHEREILKEKTIHSQIRLDVQRRAALAQRNPVANSQHQSGPLNATRPLTVATSIASNNSNSGAQSRPHQTSPPVPSHHISSNGVRVTNIGINYVPQASMQGQIPISHPSLDAGLVSRAHAISQHQQVILRQQQQQQGQVNGQPSNSPRINNISTSGYSIQGNLIPQFSSNINGTSTTSTNTLSPPLQADPCRTTQPPQALTHVQRMEIQCKVKYPSATPDQITNMIPQALSQSIQQRQNIAQNTLNGTSGGSITTLSNRNGSHVNPQVYAQIMRQQQENQQKQRNSAASGGKFLSSVTGNSVNRNTGLGHVHRASSDSLSNSN